VVGLLVGSAVGLKVGLEVCVVFGFEVAREGFEVDL
jgi:hypothetical protein